MLMLVLRRVAMANQVILGVCVSVGIFRGAE